MKPKLEEIKTFLIIVLSGLSVLCWLGYRNTQEMLTQLSDFTLDNMHKDYIYDFKNKVSHIKQIENNEIEETLYLLYFSANLDIKYIEKNKIKDIPLSNINEFKNKHHLFMQTLCNNNNYKACIQYGDSLVSKNKFDEAYTGYLKAAENKNYEAMSRLVDLYRNKSWPKNSEDIAKIWLMKIGK